MTTIVDVAKKAGVSVSTVSYTLSGVRRISDKTRQRVMSAIEELNYHPNILARGLVNKRTKIIALLYPSVASDNLDDLSLDFISSIAKTAAHFGYGLLLFISPSGEQEITRFVDEGLVDGIILMEVQRAQWQTAKKPALNPALLPPTPLTELNTPGGEGGVRFVWDYQLATQPECAN